MTKKAALDADVIFSDKVISLNDKVNKKEKNNISKNLKLKKRFLIIQKKIAFFCTACQEETKLKRTYSWEKIPMFGNKR